MNEIKLDLRLYRFDSLVSLFTTIWFDRLNAFYTVNSFSWTKIEWYLCRERERERDREPEIYLYFSITIHWWLNMAEVNETPFIFQFVVITLIALCSFNESYLDAITISILTDVWILWHVYGTLSEFLNIFNIWIFEQCDRCYIFLTVTKIHLQKSSSHLFDYNAIPERN